ncbi:hypothetical protein C8F04DRAFT_1241481 [Mycena alexandri]|uniref:NACHT domain-containing protein n=1 Tax=Mycena alexandri TaxID=1745969 RepID=A0AAD6S641_9AGAR|nr:hypothetical protein C8F04DRAFT_1241481 [Mycena alexandri]
MTPPPVSGAGNPIPLSQKLPLEALNNLYKEYPDLDPAKYNAEFSACKSADDIMTILQQRMTSLKAHRSNRWDKVRKNLEPIVQIALRVSSVVGESADAIGVPGGKGVFVALSFLLSATQEQSAKYDTLETLLERLNSFLQYFNVIYHQELSHDRPALNQIATTILTHLFYVLALSTKFYPGHYLRTVIGFPDGLKEALENLDEFRDEMHRMVGAYNLRATEQLQHPVEQIKNTVDNTQQKIHDMHIMQVDETIKKWLFGGLTIDPAAIERNNALQKHRDDTSVWILQNRAFEKWRNGAKGSVLWLHGPSGSGKTILSARLVDKLLSDIPDLAYFFFVVKNKETMDAMLASTLLQLATDGARHKILLDTYEGNKHKGPPSLQSLLNCFERMLEVPRDLVLVLDALDEHRKPRDQLLDFLQNLSQKDNVRLLVASRNEHDICTVMQTIPAAEINLNEESKQKEELCDYITKVLESEKPFQTWKIDYPGTVQNPGPVDLIKERLLKESMQLSFNEIPRFRLVVLQLDKLRDITPIDVETTLKTLPSSLVAMYDSGMQSLGVSPNPEERTPPAQRVLQVFEIIFTASQPLSAAEVAEVFTLRPHADSGVVIDPAYRSVDPAGQVMQTWSSFSVPKSHQGRINGGQAVFGYHSLSNATPKWTLGSLCRI